MTTVTIILESGQQVTLQYGATFGDVAIISLLIVLCFLYCAKWLYEICFRLWQRGSA